MPGDPASGVLPQVAVFASSAPHSTSRRRPGRLSFIVVMTPSCQRYGLWRVEGLHGRLSFRPPEGRSQSLRRLILLRSVGWLPPDLRPSGACLSLGSRACFRLVTTSRITLIPGLRRIRWPEGERFSTKRSGRMEGGLRGDGGLCGRSPRGRRPSRAPRRPRAGWGSCRGRSGAGSACKPHLRLPAAVLGGFGERLQGEL